MIQRIRIVIQFYKALQTNEVKIAHEVIGFICDATDFVSVIFEMFVD